MKRNFYKSLLMLMVSFISISCKNDIEIKPVLETYISGFVLEINKSDYVVSPQIDSNGTISNTMLVSVKQPSVEGIVKRLDFTDSKFRANVNVGDVVRFTDNNAEITISNGVITEIITIEMNFNPPPVLYVVNSGDGYKLDIEKSAKLHSITYDDSYEGYIDLSNNSWNNIGIVLADGSLYYDCNGGLNSGVSYGEFVLIEKKSPETGYYPCDGPWGDWTTNASNDLITSPGIWKVDFDLKTKRLLMLETQFAISGDAVKDNGIMTYNHEDCKWCIDTFLSVGSFRFTTIPVNSGDPSLVYGLSDGISPIVENGLDIPVEVSGKYKIELDLNNSFYNYEIIKLN